ANYAAADNFAKSYFNLQPGDWISDWVTTDNGNQRFIFSQSNGTLTVVPEPSTIVFAGIGMAMFAWSTWTRRRALARQRLIASSVA
ncbi:MAG: PEP-CTERM sorting domain-containing protein, partial [Planctomycetia bacterium]|nr:PEP-CTERM sorting domain-containing protein [Planctomycetia bacterium]